MDRQLESLAREHGVEPPARRLLCLALAVALAALGVGILTATRFPGPRGFAPTGGDSMQQVVEGHVSLSVPGSWTDASLDKCMTPSHNDAIIRVTQDPRPPGPSNLCLITFDSPNLVYLTDLALARTIALQPESATGARDFDGHRERFGAVGHGYLVIFDSLDVAIQIQTMDPELTDQILKSIHVT